MLLGAFYQDILPVSIFGGLVLTFVQTVGVGKKFWSFLQARSWKIFAWQSV